MFVSKAIDEIVRDFVIKIVASELKSILENVLRRHNAEVQRLNILKTLEDELFSAFVAEITYHCTLDAAATYMRNVLVQKHAIRLLAKRVERSVISYRYKQAKRRELQSVTFENSLKKVSSDVSSLISLGRKHKYDPAKIDFVKNKKK